jgi:hypothetical protein
MIILNIHEKGHTLLINGRTIRTPATVDITTLNEKLIQTELKKYGVSHYSIEFIPDHQIKKQPQLIGKFSKKEEPKVENIAPNNEQIENRLKTIEGLLKQLLDKPDSQNVVYVEAQQKIREAVKTLEEDVGFIPSIDMDVVLKGPSKISKVTKEETDLDKSSKALSKFLKK